MAVSGVCYWEQLPGLNGHSCVKHMKKINNWMEAGMVSWSCGQTRPQSDKPCSSLVLLVITLVILQAERTPTQPPHTHTRMLAHAHTQVHFVLLPHPPGECLSRETSACLNELYCVSVQKVTAGDQTWSVSCPSCSCSLCSPLVSTSSPPTTATNMWTYLTRSALPCVVLGVSTSMFVVGIVHVCGGQCTCVCLHTCAYVYVLLLYTYLQY